MGEQGPLPDLLPHNEHPPRAPNQDEASRERAVRESDARRLGDQLRTMGDEYNAMVLRRAVRVSFYRVRKRTPFPSVSFRKGSTASGDQLLSGRSGC